MLTIHIIIPHLSASSFFLPYLLQAKTFKVARPYECGLGLSLPALDYSSIAIRDDWHLSVAGGSLFPTHTLTLVCHDFGDVTTAAIKSICVGLP